MSLFSGSEGVFPSPGLHFGDSEGALSNPFLHRRTVKVPYRALHFAFVTLNVLSGAQIKLNADRQPSYDRIPSQGWIPMGALFTFQPMTQCLGINRRISLAEMSCDLTFYVFRQV